MNDKFIGFIISALIIATTLYTSTLISPDIESTIRNNDDDLRWVEMELIDKYTVERHGLFGVSTPIYYMIFELNGTRYTYDAIDIHEYSMYDIGQNVSVGFDDKYNNIDVAHRRTKGETQAPKMNK